LFTRVHPWLNCSFQDKSKSIASAMLALLVITLIIGPPVNATGMKLTSGTQKIEGKT
jgi:hypothetical protein